MKFLNFTLCVNYKIVYDLQICESVAIKKKETYWFSLNYQWGYMIVRGLTR